MGTEPLLHIAKAPQARQEWPAKTECRERRPAPGERRAGRREANREAGRRPWARGLARQSHDLRAGVNFPDAFVLDPVVAAEAVGRAEGLVALAARVFLHLLRQEKRGRESPDRENGAPERVKSSSVAVWAPLSFSDTVTKTKRFFFRFFIEG